MQKNSGNRLWKTIKSKLILLLPIALLIAGNLFVFGPATIYQGNNSEFSVNFVDILKYYPLPFIATSLIILSIGISLPKKYLELYACLLFSFVLLFWIQGNFLVWDYGLLDGQGIKWNTYSWQGWVDAGLWLIILPAALTFYRKIIRIVPIISIVMIFLQSMLLISTYVSEPLIFSSTSRAGAKLPERLFDYSSSFNIIHMIFDGLQTDVFQEVVKESGIDADLDGFVLFKENMAVFGTTTFSIPAIFSSEVYQGNVEMSSYVKNALSEKAFYNNLLKKGYDVNLVPGITIPAKNVTNYYMVPKVYGGSRREKNLSETAFLMDLVLFRHFPQYLKNKIYNNQKWTIAPLFSVNYKAGYFHHKSFFEDYIKALNVKTSRPSYHFIHLLPPHQPYVTCENCEYAGKVLPPTRTNYKIEVKCILRLFLKFITKLKDLGIYDSSFIIIHADHGSGFPVNMKNKPLSATKITAISPSIVGRSLAMLAIKPRNSRGEMKISNAHTILTDIPETVMDVAGLENCFQGTCVFAINAAEERERWFSNKFKVTGSVYDYQSWQRSNRGSLSRHLRAATYQWGAKIEFGFMGNAQAYQKYGWSLPEDGLTWIGGKSASLVVPITKPNSPVVLEANFMPFLSAGKVGKQIVHVSINGKEAGMWEVSNPGFGKWRLILPENLFAESDNMMLTFNVPNATSPAQLGLSGDPRSLGIAMHSLRLIEIEPYQCEATIQFGRKGNAALYCGNGWSVPEDGFTWTDGKTASLMIPVSRPKMPLILKAVFRPFLGAGKIEKQIVHVLINGKEAGTWEISKPGFRKWRLILPEKLFAESDSMVLTFNIPNATSPAQLGLSRDKRSLGIALVQIQLSK